MMGGVCFGLEDILGSDEAGQSLALPAPIRAAEVPGLSAPVTNAKDAVTPNKGISGSIKDGADGAKGTF